MRVLAAVAGSALLAAACAAPPAAPFADCAGTWTGVRRAGADGHTAAMSLWVEPLAGGRGHAERLQVQGEPQPYAGFAVYFPQAEGGAWIMLYSNATRAGFARLEGEVGPARASFRATVPGGTRVSRLEWEFPGPNRWRRTQWISEDGGSTWRALFTDELTRAPAGGGNGRPVLQAWPIDSIHRAQ